MKQDMGRIVVREAGCLGLLTRLMGMVAETKDGEVGGKVGGKEGKLGLMMEGNYCAKPKIEMGKLGPA